MTAQVYPLVCSFIALGGDESPGLNTAQSRELVQLSLVGTATLFRGMSSSEMRAQSLALLAGIYNDNYQMVLTSYETALKMTVNI